MPKHSFDKVYLLYDFIERYIFREYLHEIKIINENIGFIENKDVVDIGGGTGYIAKSIKDKVKTITIVDFSKKMLMQMKKTAIKSIQGSAYSIPIKDEIFETALLINVLHHIKKTDQNDMIKEIYRILKKDGIILVIDLFYPNKYVNRLFNKFEELATGETFHIKYYEVISKLKKAGFKDISSSFQDWRKLKYLIIAKK